MNKVALIADYTVIDQLENAPLFTKCGQEFKEETRPFTVKQLYDKKVINESLISVEWENFTLEARNTLTLYLNKFNHADFQLWNKITDLYKSELLRFETRLVKFVKSSATESTIMHDFKWIVLAMCMENHYRKLNSKIPILFLNMLPLFEAGHIPCGWQGPIERKSDGKSMDLSRGLLLVY